MTYRYGRTASGKQVMIRNGKVVAVYEGGKWHPTRESTREEREMLKLKNKELEMRKKAKKVIEKFGGDVYVAPLLGLSYLVGSRLGWASRPSKPRLLAYAWLASLGLVAASVALNSYALAFASTPLLVLCTMTLAAKAAIWALSIRLR